MSSEPKIEMIYDSNLNCVPKPEEKKLKTLENMSVAAYTHQKRYKQIKNWKKQYGIVIETDDQYFFFKQNRAMILKTLPMYEEMLKHFPAIIKQSDIKF